MTLDFSDEDLMRVVTTIVHGEQDRLTNAIDLAPDLFGKTKARLDVSPNISVQPISVAADVLMRFMHEGWFGGMSKMVNLFVEDNNADPELLIDLHVCQVIDHHVQQVVGGLCWILIEMIRAARVQGCDLAPLISALVTYHREGVTMNSPSAMVGEWLPTHEFPANDDDGNTSVPAKP